MVNSQSCSAYAPINDQVLYYAAGTIYKHSRTTGLQVSSVVITGLNETAGINTGLNIYPNPNNGAFIIKGNSANTLSITNQPGQLITSSQLNESNHYEGHVSGLAPGIYYVVSQGSDAVATWKIVVTK